MCKFFASGKCLFAGDMKSMEIKLNINHLIHLQVNYETIGKINRTANGKLTKKSSFLFLSSSTQQYTPTNSSTWFCVVGPGKVRAVHWFLLHLMHLRGRAGGGGTEDRHKLKEPAKKYSINHHVVCIARLETFHLSGITCNPEIR